MSISLFRRTTAWILALQMEGDADTTSMSPAYLQRVKITHYLIDIAFTFRQVNEQWRVCDSSSFSSSSSSFAINTPPFFISFVNSYSSSLFFSFFFPSIHPLSAYISSPHLSLSRYLWANPIFGGSLMPPEAEQRAVRVSYERRWLTL